MMPTTPLSTTNSATCKNAHPEFDEMLDRLGQNWWRENEGGRQQMARRQAIALPNLVKHSGLHIPPIDCSFALGETGRHGRG